MDNWRRQAGDFNGGFEDSRRRSMRKKPPRVVNWQPTVPNWEKRGVDWQATVPNWEKRFCKVVGDMDWESFLEKKRFVHLYDNVVRWNDSAGEEAFHNAKKRFLAQMNGWPCEIPLPSPDLYIDKVDWDAQVDVDPLLELEHGDSWVKPEEHHEPVVIFGDALISNLGLSPAGWGDEDVKVKKAVDSSWDNYHEQMPSEIKETTIENDYHVESNHLGNANPVGTGWDENWLKMEDNYHEQMPSEIKETKIENDYHVESDHHGNANPVDTGWDENWLKMEDTGKSHVPGTWQVNSNWENKNYGQQYKPRYESSRFMDSGWGDDNWLKMEGTDKNDVHGTWQVSNNWENKNGGRYKTRYESSRYMDSNNYYNKGRYNKWRSGSNNGKREAIVN